MPGRRTAVWEPRAQAAVLVPVKSFNQSKVRLAPALPAAQRAALARAMGATVLAAAAPLPVAVVCDDAEVAAWAEGLGARVIWEPGRGLNRAVTAGVALLGAEGVRQVTVAHADLPLATDLASVGLVCGVRDLGVLTLVPDRWLDGTNVAAVPTGPVGDGPVPTGIEFCFSYGPGSFRRHVDEALHLGLALQVLRIPQLAWDVDVPDDLTALNGCVMRAPASEVP